MIDTTTRPSAQFPYDIVRRVGMGSMGVVFQALDQDLERPVAIKTLRATRLEPEDEAGRSELRQRFLQEARAAAAFTHPGATTIHRIGELDEEPFIVMEWLEGRTLEDILAERQRLSVDEALEMTQDLLGALGAAHRAGIVHRDVKPSNLMLLDDGRLKVTDFGIAKLQGRELVQTQAGVIFATPQFASPEQLRGLEVDGRSDLYSVGVVAYLALTGEYPFTGRSFMDLANAILQSTPRPPREHRPDLPASLDLLLLRVLAKDPEERPGSAAEVAESIREILRPDRRSVTSTLPLTLPSDRVTESGVPVFRDLSDKPQAAIRAILETWEVKELPPQPIGPLLRRLFDRPLHTSPFAGAVEVAGITLLVSGGRLVLAWSKDGLMGDAAAARLPAEGRPRLRIAPMPGWVAGLATITHPPLYRHRDLDSSFVDLPALADKLRHDRFSGVICLEHVVESTERTARAWILLHQGRTLAALYSQGWNEVPVDQSWRRWVADHLVRASVLDLNAPVLDAWYPHALTGLRLEIHPGDEETRTSEIESGTGISRLFPGSGVARALGTAAREIRLSSNTSSDLGHESAPAFRALSWMLSELPVWLADRRREGGWKYLTEWLPLVRRARLYHPLRRPGSDERDRFDVVTFDDRGKALHLVERVDRVDPDSLWSFVERVKMAKEARIKTGDIGAALLVAPSFCDETVVAYQSILEAASSTRWLSLGETLTGYEGFVRIGARRGFHLLLVAEKKTGSLEPVLPFRP